MKNIFNYLRIFVSIALLLGLGWIMRKNLSGIGAILLNADKFLLALSVILVVIALLMQAYRLKFLFDAQSIHLSAKDVIHLTFIGQFFNNFMPTSVGGDVVKAYYASGGTHKKLETYAAVAVDRMLGVVTLMWVALAALAVNKSELVDKTAVFIIGIIFIIGVVFMALVFNKKAAKSFLFFKVFFKNQKIKEHLERLYEATSKYRRHKILIFHALWLSLAAQLVFYVMVYILTLSISSRVSFIYLLLTMPVIATISMLPSLNGLGIRESGFVYFLGSVIGSEKAFALSILFVAVMLIVSLSGGVIFLFKREFRHLEVLK